MDGGRRRAAIAARVILGLGASLAVYACGPKETLPRVAPAPATPPPLAIRVRVLNGDVLIVDQVSLRLANAYAPQPIPYAHCWAEALAAKASARAVNALVADARDIAVRTTPDRDEFNRTLAYVALDGRDVGDTLYGEGLAARRPPAVFHWCEGFSAETAGAPPLRSMMGGAPP